MSKKITKLAALLAMAVLVGQPVNAASPPAPAVEDLPAFSVEGYEEDRVLYRYGNLTAYFSKDTFIVPGENALHFTFGEGEGSGFLAIRNVDGIDLTPFNYDDRLQKAYLTLHLLHFSRISPPKFSGTLSVDDWATVFMRVQIIENGKETQLEAIAFFDDSHLYLYTWSCPLDAPGYEEGARKFILGLVGFSFDR